MNLKNWDKMTRKEQTLIQNLEQKASKRKHRPTFTAKWLVQLLLEEFKDYSYDDRQDALDMLELILDIAKKFKVMNPKQIEKERKWVIKNRIDEYFPEEED